MKQLRTRVSVATLRLHTKALGFGAGTVYVAREDPDDGFWYLERSRRQERGMRERGRTAAPLS